MASFSLSIPRIHADTPHWRFFSEIDLAHGGVGRHAIGASVVLAVAISCVAWWECGSGLDHVACVKGHVCVCVSMCVRVCTGTVLKR